METLFLINTSEDIEILSSTPDWYESVWELQGENREIQEETWREIRKGHKLNERLIIKVKKTIDNMNSSEKFDIFGELVDYGETDLSKVTGIHIANLVALIYTDSLVQIIENKLNQRFKK